MKIAVIGSGYVGLVSGACFAEMGFDITCVDNDLRKIELLNSGGVPIYEPGLDGLIAENAVAGRLRFSSDLRSTVAAADVVFIAVGTPARKDDGHADLSYVFGVGREIAAALNGFTVIVTKSTVPVGTGDEVERIVRELNPDADFAVVSNPEFLKEGTAIADFQNPDRIVIGSNDARAIERMRALYAPLTDLGHPVVVMDRRGSELTKYAANALLATKITFINEIADLCERVGTNVEHVSRGVGLDRRIGAQFLSAGPGYGGSCFPKDTLALMKVAEDFGAPQQLVETVIKVNDQRKRAMGRKVVEALGSPRDKVVAVLGLSFKANTDDVRDSPALSVIRTLQDRGAIVRVSDPEGLKYAHEVLSNVATFADPYDALEGADAVVIATEWQQFRELDLARVKSLMRGTLFVDLRNLIDIADLDAAGFRHMGVGRPSRLRWDGTQGLAADVGLAAFETPVPVKEVVNE